MEDKAPLMDLTFDTVRNILSNDTLDNATALRIAGLALAGAISYIHPYENGNGRTGRVLHYLVEFGTERGEQAFNEELYAIIGKLPMYDVDGYKKALMDTPPPELPLALGQEYNRINNQQSSATERVKIFLQMMQGLITVPIQKDVYRPGGGIIPAGIDGKSLYTKEYLDYSTIPYRKPNEAPPEAIRNLGVKKENPEYISMLMDLVD